MVQVNALIYSMGAEAEHIFKSFTFTAVGDGDKYNVVMAKFDEHFIPKRNVIYKRAQFRDVRSYEAGEAERKSLNLRMSYSNRREKTRDVRSGEAPCIVYGSCREGKRMAQGCVLKPDVVVFIGALVC